MSIGQFLGMRWVFWEEEDVPEEVFESAMSLIFNGLKTFLYEPYNIFLGLYTCNFIGWYINHKKFKIAYVIVIIVLIELAFFVIKIGFIANSLLLVLMLVMPIAIRSMNRNMELEAKLQEANQKIDALVKREERLRISRDLHDTLGHTSIYYTRT
ncbi:sensor histidine kinase [Pallidibacillus pasinlerensis]|uniref:Histidine kinase n=1 Tax=Pallidibacillus pasinlerensis TaxID=2703818 RepID=A0ABX0A879_9BACI|nr:histidine kinase [Pallidibacillus pasinlerensis]NCU17393.1 hypothetical protein [Pallidibacillus pasinlerensis]